MKLWYRLLAWWRGPFVGVLTSEVHLETEARAELRFTGRIDAA